MLFCLTTNYTPKALEAMSKNPSASRREAVEKLLSAAGAKLVAMLGTIAEGPGAMVIFDTDPSAAPAVSRQPMASKTSRCSGCSLRKG